MLELILKDITDLPTRENFFRLRNFIGEQILFDGNFKLFDVSIPMRADSFKILHGLKFIPSDVIPLFVQGDHNYFFRYSDFDREFIYVTTNGPVRLRFLAGKLKDKLGNSSSAGNTNFPFVEPGDVVRPGSPGFVYGAVGAKTTDFWLTSEGIPSNIVGVPVLFGDGTVVQAAVGTELEAGYTIGIYQHEGDEINLTLLGTFTVVPGGPKRIDLSFPIIYNSPNVQLACRLISGDTLNLKVSLIVRGSVI